IPATRAAMTSKTSACAVSSASTTTLARKASSGVIRSTTSAASPFGSQPAPTHSRPAANSASAIQSRVWSRREPDRSEEHTSELQSPDHLVCRLLLEKKKNKITHNTSIQNKQKKKKKNT